MTVSNTLPLFDSPGAPQGLIPGQFRLSQIQVYNWGTFDGLHTVPIARAGHLITGPSGSGKSTLIDAVSTILVPQTQRRFNAAADSGGSSGRSLITYCRGAWRREHAADADELTQSFLRTGPTWSGVALTFSTGTHPEAETITAVRLMYLSANAHTASDIVDLYMLLPREFSLAEASDIARNGLNIAHSKKHFPEASAVQRNHPAFIDALRKKLGIINRTALELLHKTQSTKTLGDLNHLMRTFMLPEPATFALAEKAVEQFADLESCYQSVENARRQIACLVPLRDAHRALEKIQAQISEIVADQQGLGWYVATKQLDFARAERDTARADAAAARARWESVDEELTHLRTEHEGVHTAIHGVENAGIVQARTALENQQKHLHHIETAAHQFATLAALIPASIPSTSEEFVNLRLQLEDHIAELDTQLEHLRAGHESAVVDVSDIDRKVKADVAELGSIKQFGSAMDPSLLKARELIAQAVGIEASQLPFVADCIHMADGETDWQPVAERVMHGFARQMLVPDEHYRDVTAIINATHLGTKLTYVRFTDSLAATPIGTFGPNTLGTTITVRSEGRFARFHDWIQSQLSGSFDYLCAEDVEELEKAHRAVTRDGLVKYNAHRHVKDDRYAITERRRWVLSGNVDEKIEELTASLKALREALDKAVRRRNDLAKRIDDTKNSQTTVRRLLETEDFAAIDVSRARAEVDNTQAWLDKLVDDNTDLRELQERDALLTARIAETDKQRSAIRETIGTHNSRAMAAEKQVARLESHCADLTPASEDVIARLEKAIAQHTHSARQDNLERLRDLVADELASRRRSLDHTAQGHESTAQNAMSFYVAQWPSRSGDLRPEPAYRGDFLQELERLEGDDLPRFAEQFRTMQQEQAQRNLGQIRNQIQRATREIRTSVETINESLRAVEFYPGTHLTIEVREAQPSVAKDFVNKLSQALDGILLEQTLESAEERFAVQREIIGLLRVSDDNPPRQRQLRLDTRLHVKFLGVEISSDGTKGAVYDSAEGLSGGQAQKLSSFCLAAALRYQLTGQGSSPAQMKAATVEHNDTVYPMYGTIILDEAFDRADSQFTRAAMDAFRQFGFHMILATPEKLLQTVQDYIGGVLMVQCEDRKHSRTSQLLIEVEPDDPKEK